MELGWFPKELWDWAAWDLVSAPSEVNLLGMREAVKRDDSVTSEAQQSSVRARASLHLL